MKLIIPCHLARGKGKKNNSPITRQQKKKRGKEKMFVIKVYNRTSEKWIVKEKFQSLGKCMDRIEEYYKLYGFMYVVWDII